ncbi:cytochrome c oxidase subunit 2A [Virgibacillus profundi]|nr:cytochrome c oxidase subunit 2A [Virgibacillus profundi]
MLTEEKKRTDFDLEKEPNLKGTLISVSLVGLFIVIAWVGAFILFVTR